MMASRKFGMYAYECTYKACLPIVPHAGADMLTLLSTRLRERPSATALAVAAGRR